MKISSLSLADIGKQVRYEPVGTSRREVVEGKLLAFNAEFSFSRLYGGSPVTSHYSRVELHIGAAVVGAHVNDNIFFLED